MASELLWRGAMRFAAAATVLVFVVVSACGARLDDTKGVDESACAAYVEADRAYNDRCSPSALADARVARLDARATLACTAVLSLPGTALTPERLTACASALRDTPCEGRATLAACEFPGGALPAGASCATRDQCQTGYCAGASNGCGVCRARAPLGSACAVNGDCVEGAICTGTCVLRVVRALGESCDRTKGEVCAAELFCDDSTRVCEARVVEGAPCGASSACLQGLACSPTSATCVVPVFVGAGENCGDGAHYCERGLVCDPAGRTCGKVTPVPPGGRCAKGVLCERGLCDVAAGRCPMVVPDGGACDADDPSRVCDAYASCVAGKCMLKGQLVCE